jgi:hypothetical protein
MPHCALRIRRHAGDAEDLGAELLELAAPGQS